MRARSLAAAVALALLPVVVPVSTGAGVPVGTGVAAAATKPNIFFYNLDDLRDAFPGGIDPLQFMPKTRQWMAAGTRFTQHFVAEPSCCPSRSSLMTGRYPHNNGVRPAVAGTELRRAALDGLLPAERRLRDVRGRASSSRPGRRPSCRRASTTRR